MKGKTVLVTGASRGIGRAAARLFAARGCRVAVNYLGSGGKARQLVEELLAGGCDAMAVQADVADRQQVERMFSQVEQRLGQVEILVNNAGIAQQKVFCDIQDEDWRRMFAVTVDGAFYCCRRALPGMLLRQAGRIVNVSSVWGITGASCEVHYAAAKAALIGLTRALARELGPSQIQVNCVAPGVIETDMCAGFDESTLSALREETPLGRLGRPEEVAEAIVFLAGEQANFITGQVLSPNGGFVI